MQSHQNPQFLRLFKILETSGLSHLLAVRYDPDFIEEEELNKMAKFANRRVIHGNDVGTVVVDLKTDSLITQLSDELPSLFTIMPIAGMCDGKIVTALTDFLADFIFTSVGGKIHGISRDDYRQLRLL